MARRCPLVSVIIPAYNCARFLPEAVETVHRQSYKPLEIIILDDGSTDHTAAVARSFGKDVRYARQTNQGPAAARNAALTMTRGEIIAFLDADDLWPEGRLDLLLRCLTAKTQLQAVLGQVQCLALQPFQDGERRFMPWGRPQACLSLGAALIRTVAFRQIGPLDPSLGYSEDMDWFLRAREQGLQMLVVDQPVLYYRQHDSNLTRAKTPRDLLIVEVLKRSLDRRRGSPGGRQSLPEIPRLSKPSAEAKAASSGESRP